jgi:hypothetical protein
VLRHLRQAPSAQRRLGKLREIKIGRCRHARQFLQEPPRSFAHRIGFGLQFAGYEFLHDLRRRRRCEGE